MSDNNSNDAERHISRWFNYHSHDAAIGQADYLLARRLLRHLEECGLAVVRADGLQHGDELRYGGTGYFPRDPETRGDLFWRRSAVGGDQ